jgi:hypothetical protein
VKVFRTDALKRKTCKIHDSLSKINDRNDLTIITIEKNLAAPPHRRFAAKQYLYRSIIPSFLSLILLGAPWTLQALCHLKSF